jgi:WhiB family redox-sensing transcriptional regulator
MAREHGKYSTYTKGCRCDLCRKAGTEHHREWRARKKKAAGLPSNPADWFTYIPEGDTSWMAQSACRTVNTALFFPGRGETGNIAKAKAVCQTCQVRTDCLSYAIRNNQTVGIWGGQSGRALRALRNEYLQGNVA